MCPDGDGDFTPGQEDIGVVVLLFGDGPDAVCELERLDEVFELKLFF